MFSMQTLWEFSDTAKVGKRWSRRPVILTHLILGHSDKGTTQPSVQLTPAEPWAAAATQLLLRLPYEGMNSRKGVDLAGMADVPGRSVSQWGTQSSAKASPDLCGRSPLHKT